MGIAETFIIGFIGALAPEIVRLYSLRDRQNKLRVSKFYIGVSILFAGLGGIVALVLPATTPWAAFYAGISTPAIINVAAKKILRKSNRPQRKGGFEVSSFHTFIEAL